MNICYLCCNELCDEQMCYAFEEAGHKIYKMSCDDLINIREKIQQLLESCLSKMKCDIVFSFDFFPELSNACMEFNLKYVSWVYDNCSIQVYSHALLNSCNLVFLFDYVMYEELKKTGINTVFYLPLAIGTQQAFETDMESGSAPQYSGDISLVNSLCTDKKNDEFDGLDSFTKGYFDGLIQAQKSVREYYFLEELLTNQVVEELKKVYTVDWHDTILTPKKFYARQMLCGSITFLEQQEILRLLCERYQVLFDEEDEKDRVRCSKINLNITSREIQSGIPWRALEVMGNGGFLLSNYQQELFEYFEPDKDFVCYFDYDDLLEKIDYYLKHEEAREKIARSGWEKVHKEHTFRQRIPYMLEVVTEGD